MKLEDIKFKIEKFKPMLTDKQWDAIFKRVEKETRTFLDKLVIREKGYNEIQKQ